MVTGISQLIMSYSFCMVHKSFQEPSGPMLVLRFLWSGPHHWQWPSLRWSLPSPLRRMPSSQSVMYPKAVIKILHRTNCFWWIESGASLVAWRGIQLVKNEFFQGPWGDPCASRTFQNKGRSDGLTSPKLIELRWRDSNIKWQCCRHWVSRWLKRECCWSCTFCHWLE